jgi:hypothetical protein
MLSKGDHDKFLAAIIAQHDDEDYQESGYVIVNIGDWYALSRYGHCSCFGTWADLTGGGISDDEGPDDPRWDWQGTREQLLDMATRRADPAMPDRNADPKDYDYDHLVNVYDQILAKLYAGKI